MRCVGTLILKEIDLFHFFLGLHHLIKIEALDLKHRNSNIESMKRLSIIILFSVELFCLSWNVSGLSTRRPESSPSTLTRMNFLRNVESTLSIVTSVMSIQPTASLAVRGDTDNSASAVLPISTSPRSSPSFAVAYRSISLPIREFGIEIPLACWFPVDDKTILEPTQLSRASSSVTYKHQISIKRIGQLLAGWNFIPEFASQKFQLVPSRQVMDGALFDLPSSPV